jgi:hypothetical protein
MRARRLLVTAVIVAATCVALASFSAEQIVGQFTEPLYPTDWDTGALERTVTNNLNQRKTVAIRFSARPDERLNSVVLSTTDWSLDLSSYVRDLLHPVPHRIGVAFAPDSFDDAGKIRRLHFSLPHFARTVDPLNNSISDLCTVLNLEITAGQVGRVETVRAPDELWCSH